MFTKANIAPSSRAFLQVINAVYCHNTKTKQKIRQKPSLFNKASIAPTSRAFLQVMLPHIIVTQRHSQRHSPIWRQRHSPRPPLPPHLVLFSIFCLILSKHKDIFILTAFFSHTQHCLGPGIPYTEVWTLHDPSSSSLDSSTLATEPQTPPKLSISPRNSLKTPPTPSSQTAETESAFLAVNSRKPAVPRLLRRLESNAQIRELLNRWPWWWQWWWWRCMEMMTMMTTMMMMYRTAVPELRLVSIPLPGTSGGEAKLQVYW